MKFPIRQIHQIEITSRCNLKCRYCPSYRLDMTRGIYWKALQHAAAYQRRFGIAELNLAGIGESTLHPDFVEFVALAREVMGEATPLILATNGLLVDRAMARALKPHRVNVYVSLHRPEKAAAAVEACKAEGILTAVSCDGALNSVDWAGQMDWPVTTPAAGSECPWIKGGLAFVLADGRVSRCCFDADASGVFAHVDDLLPADLAMGAYKHCAKCHLKTGIAEMEAVA